MIQTIRLSIKKKAFGAKKGHEPSEESSKVQSSSTITGLFRAANEVQVVDATVINAYKKLGIVKT